MTAVLLFYKAILQSTYQHVVTGGGGGDIAHLSVAVGG